MPGMYPTIVIGVLLKRAKNLLCSGVCFDSINHMSVVAPCCKTNKSEAAQRHVCLRPEPTCSLTVQFQLCEYFMKSKDPEVTGMIKAYKSLNHLRLVLQMQTHAEKSIGIPTNKHYTCPSNSPACRTNKYGL